MDFSDLSKQLAQILVGFPGIQLVYVFGSQVSGNVGPMSDTDLALLCDPPDDDGSLQFRFQRAVAPVLGTDRVDVIHLNRAPIELAYHIISQGKLLYETDRALRVEFEARVLGLYGDYLPVLRAYRDQILRGDEYARRVQRYRETFRRTERTLSEIGSAKNQKPG